MSGFAQIGFELRYANGGSSEPLRLGESVVSTDPIGLLEWLVLFKEARRRAHEAVDPSLVRRCRSCLQPIRRSSLTARGGNPGPSFSLVNSSGIEEQTGKSPDEFIASAAKLFEEIPDD